MKAPTAAVQLMAKLLGKAAKKKKKAAAQPGQTASPQADGADAQAEQYAAQAGLTARHQYCLRRSSRIADHRSRANPVSTGTMPVNSLTSPFSYVLMFSPCSNTVSQVVAACVLLLSSGMV